MQGSLARKLRVLRAERGLTLRQAAEQAGVRPGTLSELERGLHRPHDITLSRVAKGYGVPVEELLEEPVPLAKASQETRRLEEERRKVEDKVEELVALGRGEADPYQVQWALDEAQDCWLTLLLALPGSRWEGNRIVSESNPFSMDKSQWEQREQAENARRFYYEILGRLMEAGLVELRERPGQKPEPVAVGIGA